ncbi:MAG: hypothetical protein QG670_2612, partial [Thermoproteota archaeon]|nr:hypothetical protein [Thermoproteota archaeon]
VVLKTRSVIFVNDNSFNPIIRAFENNIFKSPRFFNHNESQSFYNEFKVNILLNNTFL